MAAQAGSSSQASSPAPTQRKLDESVAGYPQSKGIKHCCVCGADVAGRKRYKDHDGRYWCEECKEAGREPGDGIPCADCHIATQPAELVEHSVAQGTLRLCKACDTKRKQAEKREKARIAAALEEARQEERHRKHLKIAAGIAVVLALAGGAYALLT